MDKTEEYIKMCEKATKYLEGHWRGDTGDFFFVKHLNQVLVVEDSHRGEFGMPEEIYWNRGQDYVHFEDIVPLFRQDQLQDILDKAYAVYDLFDIFDHEFLEQYWVGGAVRCPKWLDTGWSMEMFWLAMVMNEKHNKIWNGEDWVSA